MDSAAAMIRAVIFDFNGVLVDDESVHFELFREVLAAGRRGDHRARITTSATSGYDDRGCFEAALGDAGQALDRAAARRPDRAEGRRAMSRWPSRACVTSPSRPRRLAALAAAGRWRSARGPCGRRSSTP